MAQKYHSHYFYKWYAAKPTFRFAKLYRPYLYVRLPFRRVVMLKVGWLW